MDILINLPIIYVMTFLIAAFFEKETKKQKIFTGLAFLCAVIEVFTG